MKRATAARRGYSQHLDVGDIPRHGSKRWDAIGHHAGARDAGAGLAELPRQAAGLEPGPGHRASARGGVAVDAHHALEARHPHVIDGAIGGDIPYRGT